MHLNIAFGICAVIQAFVIAYLGYCLCPFYRSKAITSPEHRNSALDGLRGMLAVCVMIHHSSIYLTLSIIGFWKEYWQSPNPVFYKLLGFFGVALFFQLSGFLFWSRCVHAKGKLNLWAFYTGRLLRLYPLYIFSLPFVFLFASMLTDWKWPESGMVLLQEIKLWVPMRILPWFSHGERVFAVDNIEYSWRINSVIWSLRFEIMFYLMLPLMSFFYSARRFPILLAILLVLFKLGTDREVVPLFIVSGNFIAGMTIAWLKSIKPELAFMKSPLVSALMMALLFFTPQLQLQEYDNRQTIFLALAVMLPVVYGNSLFGLLTSAPAKILGEISYSIYLLHSLFFFGVLTVINLYFFPSSYIHNNQIWLIVLLTQAAVIGTSLITYRWIEYPAIRLGHRIALRD